jgi:hypothetical protein
MTKRGNLLFPHTFPPPGESGEPRLEQIKGIYHFDLPGWIAGQPVGLGSKPATAPRAKSGLQASLPLGGGLAWSLLTFRGRESHVTKGGHRACGPSLHSPALPT